MSQVVCGPYDQDEDEHKDCRARLMRERLAFDELLVSVQRWKRSAADAEDAARDEHALFFILGMLAGCTVMMLLVLVVGS